MSGDSEHVYQLSVVPVKLGERKLRNKYETSAFFYGTFPWWMERRNVNNSKSVISFLAIDTHSQKGYSRRISF